MQAFNPANTKGRRKAYDEELAVHDLDPFMSDYLKIIQSKAHRRLAYKTQVMCSPENPHVRTRGVHTNEVLATATIISEMLGLNTKLCQAISAGHDIGHTPYGHLGERMLTELSGKPFRHNVFSVVVAQHIERKGYGLNLTHETLQGILYHSRGDKELVISKDMPQEYSVVMYSDKIAYTFSDMNDAIRYGYLTEEQAKEYVSSLGANQRVRLNSCIQALVNESRKKGYVSFTEGPVFEAFDRLKKFMYDNVYYRMDFTMHKEVLKKAYEFFESLGYNPIIAIALMTDMEMNAFGNFLIQNRKPDLHAIKHFGVFEILPYLRKDIDPNDPDLDW